MDPDQTAHTLFIQEPLNILVDNKKHTFVIMHFNSEFSVYTVRIFMK